MCHCIMKPTTGNQLDPVFVVLWLGRISISLTIKYLQLIKLLFTLKHLYKDGDVISWVNLYSPRTGLRVGIGAWITWTEDHSR